MKIHVPEGTNLDPTSRLRLATRIHFALLRQFGTTVAVSDLLEARGEGREALWVCAASGDPELEALARDLARANERSAAKPVPVTVRAAVPAQRAGRVPQDTAWSQDTSGFGSSRLAEPGLQPTRRAAAPSWFAPMDWLRRSAAR
jgi:hypothetical protein